jgi:hypothetical protein
LDVAKVVMVGRMEGQTEMEMEAVGRGRTDVVVACNRSLGSDEGCLRKRKHVVCM